MPDKPEIRHFSDLLCVWAYVAHVRLEELAHRYGDQVAISLHFCPVFPDAHGKIETAWKTRGGFEGYGAHVAHVAAGFDHVSVHPDVWQKVRPRSSGSAHLFLKAVALSDKAGGRLEDSALFRASWALRQAFFAEARDISDWREQAAVAETLGLDIGAIEGAMRSGAAMAALEADMRFCEQNHITGSPTFRMNEGRQILYGNVGFHLIEANVKELLRRPARDEASWC